MRSDAAIKSPTLTEIEEAIQENYGWCIRCQDFTADGVDPDGCGYECPVCEESTVYGAEEALLMGEYS
jgi:hypothetical protein